MLVACRDAASPAVPPTLPAFVTADLAGFDSIFSGSAALYSFTGRPFTRAGPYYAPPPTLPAASAPQLSGLFADSVLGASFVFDCGVFHYAQDTSLHDAPADGIRIELYWEDDSHAPVCPLGAVGYVDTHDVGSLTNPALDVGVASLNGDTTFVSESLTATLSAGRYRLSSVGFLSDGVRRFDLAGTSTGVDSADADTLSMTREASGARLFLSHQWSNAGAEVDLTIDLRLVHGADTVRVTGTRVLAAANTEHLTVSVNGAVFGDIVQSGDSVAVRGPGGRDVTPAEREAMGWLEVSAFFAPYYLTLATHPLADLLGIRPYLH